MEETTSLRKKNKSAISSFGEVARRKPIQDELRQTSTFSKLSRVSYPLCFVTDRLVLDAFGNDTRCHMTSSMFTSSHPEVRLAVRQGQVFMFGGTRFEPVYEKETRVMNIVAQMSDNMIHLKCVSPSVKFSDLQRVILNEVSSKGRYESRSSYPDEREEWLVEIDTIVDFKLICDKTTAFSMKIKLQ